MPPRGTEGSTRRICLLLTVPGVPSRPRRVCSAGLRVRKCEACTRPGDTLGTLAGEFGTDWLQLWGANTQVAGECASRPRLFHGGFATGLTFQDFRAPARRSARSMGKITLVADTRS